MKKFYVLLVLVFGFSAFGQQRGISYQAVIINPKAVIAPGYNSTTTPLDNKSICLSFQILNDANQVEYQESQPITTDAYGMVNLVIGNGTSGAGLVSKLDAVNWNQGIKKLVIAVNTDGVCSNYTEISNQVLNYTPYSFYAQNADLKDGYVTDVKVAMGINPAKVGLGNVNNTSDVNKPLSTATQTALNLKANSADVSTTVALKENLSNKSSDIVTDGTSTIKYPTVKAIKDYVDAQNAAAGVADGSITSAKITNGTIVNEDVAATAAIGFSKLNIQKSDVVGLGLSKADIGLATVDNTSDANKPVSIAAQTALDLKAYSADVTTSLALKANLASPTFTGTVSGIDKTMVGLNNIDNTTDANKPVSTAAQTALDLKANSADVTTSLALKANLASPTFTGTVSGIDKTMVGLNNVDNTSDANKPVSTATQTALDLKANSTDVTTSLALKANLASPTFTGSVTAPIYASTPQALTDAATIDWNPTLGLNASVTLGGNRTLSFESTPAVGSYGTLIVTQDATGSRTLTLPSTANIVLGSTSITTVVLSTTANAKDILNFYYDGTNCYWNIGQGYGVSPIPVSAATLNTARTIHGGSFDGTANVTNIIASTFGGTGNAYTKFLGPSTTEKTFTLPDANATILTNNAVVTVAQGGTGATTLTGLVKGNGTSALTAAVSGTDYQAPLNLTTTGTGAATLSGTSLNIPTPSSSSGTAHTVGESYGGGIIFYITTGGFHGLIADTYENGNASNEEALDFVTNPTYHNSTYSGNLYTDWRVPTYYELTLLYAARATNNLNLTGATYISCTYTAYSTYKNLKFSNNTIQYENANWVPRTLRAIRSF
jgi:hypothetical protein